MTNLKKTLGLTSLLGSVMFLAVACGGGGQSGTPMRPSLGAGGGVANGATLMKSFRAYKADSKLSSGVSGASADIRSSAAAVGSWDVSVRILLHSSSGELVGLRAGTNGLELSKPRLLDMDGSCGNSKFEVEAMCSSGDCAHLVVRVIEKPAVNAPKLSELEVGKPNPDTTGYAQTGLVFARSVPAIKAVAARSRVAGRRAVQAGAAQAAVEPTPAVSTAPVKMVRRWSERWTSTADVDAAANVKTTFEEAVALAKKEGTNTSVVDVCIDPSAAAAPSPTTPEPAATSVEPAADAAATTPEGVSEISSNPLSK